MDMEQQKFPVSTLQTSIENLFPANTGQAKK